MLCKASEKKISADSKIVTNQKKCQVIYWHTKYILKEVFNV